MAEEASASSSPEKYQGLKNRYDELCAISLLCVLLLMLYSCARLNVDNETQTNGWSYLHAVSQSSQVRISL
jgi:hypothetical protein